MPSMKKILASCAVLVGGVALGGGVSYGTSQMLGTGAPASQGAASAPTQFVQVQHLLAPLVHPDGQLSGYVAFNFELEVGEDEAAAVEARLPLLLHGINMRTYRKPLASGPDGLLPELGGFRTIVEEAGAEAFGKGVVRNVAVTEAVPA